MSTAPPDEADEPISRSGWQVLVGLVGATTLAAAGQMTLVTLSGIVGAELSGNPALATLPITASVTGLALAALPVALLIRRFGRRAVFTLLSVWAACGAVVATLAINNESFVGFCIGCFMIGNNMAAMAQYRFAVADSVPVGLISRAVSAIMLGTLAAAIYAPWLALEVRDLLAADFSGSYLVLVVPFLLVSVITFFLPLAASSAAPVQPLQVGSLSGVLRGPDVQLAIIAAAIGFGVMSLIMTATPISMHVMDGMSVDATANAIRGHMLAMYVPSLFSGWLIGRIGVMRALWLGLLLEAGTLVFALLGHTEWHYIASMVMLGAGWNFLFVGGTTLLATSVHGEFKYRVQGVNELVMFGSMAVGSLFAGPMLSQLGWIGTNIAACLFLILIVMAILRARTPT